MQSPKMIDLTQGIVEDGYQNPAFEDGSLQICMDYDPDGWHAEVYQAATHVGTHIDAPMHRLEGGAPLSDYPIERFVGRAVTADLRGFMPDTDIGADTLRGYEIKKNDFVLLYTGWDAYRSPETKDTYLNHSPFLSPDGARFLAEKEIGMVLIDHFSIGGARDSAAKTHEILMNANILIAEGLKFSEWLLKEGEEWCILCAPMKLEGCSGAPARIFGLRLSGGSFTP